CEGLNSSRSNLRRLTLSRTPLSLPAETDLLRLQSGIPKGRDDEESVAVPLRGLAEFQVERFSCRSDNLAVRQDHLSAERPGGAGDHGDPIATAELDRVRGVHVHVREDP